MYYYAGQWRTNVKQRIECSCKFLKISELIASDSLSFMQKKFIQDIPIDTVIEVHIATVNPIVDAGGDEVLIPLERKEQFRRAIGDGVWVSVHDSSLTASLITSYQKGNNIPM